MPDVETLSRVSNIEAVARRIYHEHAQRRAIDGGDPTAIQGYDWYDVYQDPNRKAWECVDQREKVRGIGEIEYFAGKDCVMYDGGEAAIQALANRYKIFHAALMKYLREKLCGGLPGPSVSMVMAILGCLECKERLLKFKMHVDEEAI